MIFDKRKIWLSVYTFLAIFQPPILPVSFIYVFGIITVLLLIYENQIFCGKSLNGNLICSKSTIGSTYKRFFLLGIYLAVVSCIDILLIATNNTFTNRIQCVNQLLILTGIELLAVWYILKKAKDYNYGFYDILSLIIIAGILQGICAVLAYMFPFVRSLFTRYGGAIYENDYVWSRRGFGFSMTLLDTFGYGMGVILGCALMSFKRRKFRNIISILLCIFAIIMNARTGIIISAIAFMLFVLTGGGRKHSAIYYVIAIVALMFIVFWGIPFLISVGEKSSNITLSWVAGSMQEFYEVIFTSNGNLTSASFLSNLTVFPENVFEFIFGSGHSVYGIADIIGFHSDVGYVNLLWIYGLVGGLTITAIIIAVFVKAFKSAQDKTQKIIVVFLFVSYFVVQLKAILIGYNPGVMITYIILFSLIYHGKNKESKKKVLNLSKAGRVIKYE